jgi:hypothetical protein
MWCYLAVVLLSIGASMQVIDFIMAVDWLERKDVEDAKDSQ